MLGAVGQEVWCNYKWSSHRPPYIVLTAMQTQRSIICIWISRQRQHLLFISHPGTYHQPYVKWMHSALIDSLTNVTVIWRGNWWLCMGALELQWYSSCVLPYNEGHWPFSLWLWFTAGYGSQKIETVQGTLLNRLCRWITLVLLSSYESYRDDCFAFPQGCQAFEVQLLSQTTHYIHSQLIPWIPCFWASFTYPNKTAQSMDKVW